MQNDEPDMPYIEKYLEVEMKNIPVRNFLLRRDIFAETHLAKLIIWNVAEVIIVPLY